MSQTPFGFWYVLDRSTMMAMWCGSLWQSQTPFGFWYVLDSPISGILSTTQAKMSQTPFGFWYVLDTEYFKGYSVIFKKAVTNAFRLLVCLGHLRSSRMGWNHQGVTNAFRLLVCLGPWYTRRESVADAKGHKRLSAFGMSWTPRRGPIKGMVAGHRSQTPFGFWYVLDSPKGTNQRDGGRTSVTNAFRLLVCLGQKSESWFNFSSSVVRHKRLSAFGMSWTVALLGGLRQAVYDARLEAPRFRGVFGGGFCGEPMCSRSWMPLKKNGLTRFGGTTPFFEVWRCLRNGIRMETGNWKFETGIAIAIAIRITIRMNPEP